MVKEMTIKIESVEKGLDKLKGLINMNDLGRNGILGDTLVIKYVTMVTTLE